MEKVLENTVRDTERWSLKLCAPGSLQAHTKAAALIKETCRTEPEGFIFSVEMEGVCKGSLAALADDVSVRYDGSRSCGRKVILPNTQSINGL